MFKRIGLLPFIAIITFLTMLGLSAASANPLAMFAPAAQSKAAPATVESDDEERVELPTRFKRQVVNYRTTETPGTIVVDTPNTYLYFVLGNGKAIRYGIGVGREGFTWSGVKSIERKAEWPDWHPPAEMIARQPYLPRFTAGGPGNPLGARAMYLGGTVYRIHGTNNPATIGHQVSSGCIRLTNDDVTDLYERAQIGGKVVVLPQSGHERAAQTSSSNMTTAYAAQPAPSWAAATWTAIRPSNLY